MPRKQPEPSRPVAAGTRPLPSPVEANVAEALAWLERHGSAAGRAGMERYAIPSDKAFGVAMRDIQVLAKRLGRHHDLAEALRELTGPSVLRRLARPQPG